MNDTKKKFLTQSIANINNIYDSLYNLSNDELREKSYRLQECIRKTKGDEVLDEKMEECFAIVKETARRFCQGDIEVTANEYDKEVAQQYDFVDIKEELAIYHNKWSTRGIETTWDMVHYDTQIMCGILLHEGYASEMATGEGKTLSVIMPAFLNAIRHKGVHIQTANDYLSKRDCEQTRPLYMFHGLSVDCIEYYSDNKNKKKKAYFADVVFGGTHTFVFDYLQDNNVNNIEDIVQRKHNYCIIDELDSILIDRACSPYVIGRSLKINDFISELQNIKIIVEKFINLENFDEMLKIDPVNNHLDLTQNGINWFNNEFHTDGLFSENQNDKDIIDENLKNEIAKKQSLTFNIYLMLFAYLLLKKDVNYIIDDNKVIIINPNTGRLEYNSRWEHGLHTAVEIKENVYSVADNEADGIISIGNYLKLYKKISGTSGTLCSVSAELEQYYGIKYYKIPTYKPNIRKDHPIRVYRSIGEKYKALVCEIKKYHTKHRPILVSCISTEESDLIYEILLNNKLESKKLNAKNLEKEAFIISHAGESDSIMVSTAIAGRGTDIKLTKESRNAGGLVVISTCLFDSSRIDDQLKGRAGRQGDPGDSIFFVSLEDTIIQNLSEEERKKLYKLTTWQQLNCKSSRSLVLLAQKYKEASLKQTRESLRKSDDLFSIYRKKFYKERYSILKRPNIIYKQIIDEATKYGVTKDIYSHLDMLYKQICFIIRNAKRDNVFRIVPILFSNNQNLFVLRFDADKTLNSKDYFIIHYIQQLTIYGLDKYWSSLIGYYDSHRGIDNKHLSKLYKSIKTDLNVNVLSFAFKSLIPVNFPNLEITQPNIKPIACTHVLKSIKSECIIDPSSPCPCGSNKQYYDCHGKRWRFIKQE